MWILPRQLHTSPFVPDTEALISDSDEFSQLCAQSLTARGKDSAARIWSAKLKRDSWMQLLFGRTLRPSHGSSFVDAWTSSLAATRASHSAQPASASVPKTHDTSGPTYQPELLQCDQVSVSLKTSRDISALGFPTCCKTWQEWVTERRGAWRARVNAARLTSGSGSLSWPTATAFDFNNTPLNRIDGTGKTYKSNLKEAVHQNWPTVRASEYKDVGPVGSKSHDHMLGKHYLCAVVTQDAATNGQAAPASSSSLGSRQGLWPTARSLDGSVNESLETWTARYHRKEAEGINLHRPLPIAVMQEQVKAQDFPTPRTCDWKSSPNADSNIKGMNEQAQWLTPKVPSGGGQATRTTDGGGLRKLEDQTEARATGKLNQAWVCCLMGVPVGWVDPLCPASVIKNWPRFVSGWVRPQTAQIPCDSSAMELCPPPQSELSEFSLAS